MHTYTALYDNRQDAEAAQNELQRLGIIETDGANIADRSAFADVAGRASAGAQAMPADSATGEQKGLWASLKGAFLPEEDRRMYETGVREGGYLLTVNVDDQNADRVHALLERSNAVDLDEREAQYRQTGLLPPAGLNAGQTSMGRTENLAGGEQTIPVVEEQIRVGKREVSRGGVRVRSYVIETPVHEEVRLRDEHVEVERRPVDQPLRGGLGASEGPLQERTIEMTETAEEAVVAKDARVVEEVVLRKQSGEHVETIDDTVRRTEVEVERMPGADTKGQAR